MELLRRRRDQMLLEVAGPVRREPARATAGAQLQRAFYVPQFDPEPGEGCEHVDDQPTAVTGDVIALVGIRFCLDRAVDADGVGDPLFFAPSVRLASLSPGRSVAERTPRERLLHHLIRGGGSTLKERRVSGPGGSTSE
jgi:hypothetical protein